MGNVEAALSRTIDKLMDDVQALREDKSRLANAELRLTSKINELRMDNSELRQQLFLATQEIGRLQEQRRQAEAQLRAGLPQAKEES